MLDQPKMVEEVVGERLLREIAAKRQFKGRKLPSEKPGKGLGNFLKHKIVDNQFSREEAARRAKISEGYLSHLLAGNIAMPHPDVFRDIATGWEFNRIEALEAMNLVGKRDIEEYVAMKKMGHGDLLAPRANTLIHRLTTLPKAKQEKAVALFLASLTLLDEWNS